MLHDYVPAIVNKRVSEQLAEESFEGYGACRMSTVDFADYCWHRAEKTILTDRKKKRARRKLCRAIYQRLLYISLGYMVASLLGKLIVAIFL